MCSQRDPPKARARTMRLPKSSSHSHMSEGLRKYACSRAIEYPLTSTRVGSRASPDPSLPPASITRPS
eukprot:4927312-Pyramimonas_sp.AAC.2